MKTQKILLTAITAFAMVGTTSNADTFSNGGGNNQYDNPANWTSGTVPEASTVALAIIFGAGILLLFRRRSFGKISR